MQQLLRWFALVSALLVDVGLLVLPRGAYQRETRVTGGAVLRESGRTTLLETFDGGLLVALSIPLLASLSAVLPWPAGARRAMDVASAVVVTVFCILGSLSVGPFFYPTALALVILAVSPRAYRPAT